VSTALTGPGASTGASGRDAARRPAAGASRAAALLLAACVVAAAPLAGQSSTGTPPSRGELLYSTHCVACHTTKMHWRQKKLATDWASLERQVRRWAANAGLAWPDEDVAAVARYLNAAYYRFPLPSVTGQWRRETARQVARAH
jgi:mono/diheme cytochrome c family protein